MNGTNGNEPGYPEKALVPYPVILAATKGDPDAMKIVLYEDCLAAFQRLHSPPLHAEAVRRARERLFWRRPRHSGTAASKTDDGCPHL